MPFANLACPKCGTSASPGVTRCPKCDTLLDPGATLIPRDAETVLDLDATQVDVDSGGLGAPTDWTTAPSDAPASYESLTVGAVIGSRYEILRLLGEGGMGSVYEARDRELDRVVALKVIRPQLAENPEILRMFMQELILARQVTHPNVIRIFDLGLVHE